MKGMSRKGASTSQFVNVWNQKKTEEAITYLSNQDFSSTNKIKCQKRRML